MKQWLFLLAAGYLILAGSNASATTEKEKSASNPPASSASADNASAGALSGKVVETMNSGGYTYVCLEKKGKKTWVAVPEMKVTVGQEIAFQPGAEMRNFPSKTLNRTFDRIIFSGGPASPQSASGKQANQASVAGPGSMGASAPAGKNVKVEKAAGADAHTVGEIFAKRKALDKKTVVVRGKVVKVSAGIMGANWIHVQDGTGDAKKSTHDLVVTSQDLPSVGDVVTLKGILSMDKDFGAGYRYDVIVEKASIQR
jgi:hypothetical protein